MELFHSHQDSHGTNMEPQTSSFIPLPQKALPSPSQTNLKLSSKGNPSQTFTQR